jgi:zinc transporter ZupT
MTATTSILLRTCAAFAIALAGGALSALLARSHKQLCALISIGAGTLLGVAVFGIVPECFESMRWWQLVLAAGSGYALFALISRHIFHVCPACAASHFDEAITHHFRDIAVPLMIALAIHCTVDGLALAAGNEETSINSGHRLDASMTLAICVHKIPEGLALGALLLGAGFRRQRMLWFVAAVESTTILGGAFGGLVLRNISDFWLAATLAHAAGGFFYLATHAIIGEILKHEKKLVIVNFLVGFSAIAGLILLFHLKD